MKSLPEWVIFHIPHDSIIIPAEVRYQFVLDDQALVGELIKMTDHLTLDLFTKGVPEQQIVRAPVSRLVVDVERFVDDTLEPMVTRGMGVVYERTSDGTTLRNPLIFSERQAIIDSWYLPHHDRLIKLTQQLLDRYNKVLLIDAHSFSSLPLPYEPDQQLDRPHICIGTDDFHTPKMLESGFLKAFQEAGFRTRLNAPFSGALVPMPFYQSDHRVSSIMVEINRTLYLDENTGEASPAFDHTAWIIRQCLTSAISFFEDNE